jgi:hypothetical protein
MLKKVTADLVTFYSSNLYLGQISRKSIIFEYARYASEIENLEGKASRAKLIKPVVNLYHGISCSRAYRRFLSSAEGSIPVADLILNAVDRMETLTISKSYESNQLMSTKSKLSI